MTVQAEAGYYGVQVKQPQRHPYTQKGELGREWRGLHLLAPRSRPATKASERWEGEGFGRMQGSEKILKNF